MTPRGVEHPIALRVSAVHPMSRVVGRPLGEEHDGCSTESAVGAGSVGGRSHGCVRCAACHNIVCVIHELYEAGLEPQVCGQAVPAPC